MDREAHRHERLLYSPAAATAISFVRQRKDARELMSQPDIDAALVGGASLDPPSRAHIIKAAQPDE